MKKISLALLSIFVCISTVQAQDCPNPVSLKPHSSEEIQAADRITQLLATLGGHYVNWRTGEIVVCGNSSKANGGPNVTTNPSAKSPTAAPAAMPPDFPTFTTETFASIAN